MILAMNRWLAQFGPITPGDPLDGHKAITKSILGTRSFGPLPATIRFPPPAVPPLAGGLAIFKRTSRSRQSELCEPPVLQDIRSDHPSDLKDLSSIFQKVHFS